jgi:hypothetical protein
LLGCFACFPSCFNSFSFFPPVFQTCFHYWYPLVN